MGDYDTDVAEYLYKEGATRAGVTKLLCKELSKACVGKAPRVPKVEQKIICVKALVVSSHCHGFIEFAYC